MATDRERMLAAIRAVQRFHRVGLASLRQRPEKAEYASRDLETEAMQVGMNADTLRKARAFAHPVSGYSSKELKKFCDAMRRNWPNFAARNSAIGPTHVILLMSVPKARNVRASVQNKMFREGWSTSILQFELRRLFGRRRQGGRKAAVGSTVAEVLIRIDVQRETWLRMFSELERRDTDGTSAGLKDLPSGIRSVVSGITLEMGRIGDLIAALMKHGKRSRL